MLNPLLIFAKIVSFLTLLAIMTMPLLVLAQMTHDVTAINKSTNYATILLPDVVSPTLGTIDVVWRIIQL